jgi:hypothetical protein
MTRLQRELREAAQELCEALIASSVKAAGSFCRPPQRLRVDDVKRRTESVSDAG